MINPFKKISQVFSRKQVQKKSFLYPSMGDSLYQRLIWSGWNILSPYIAIQYYMQCSVLADAIDTISREVKSIEPVIFDKRRERFIYSHPLLDLLAYPNADVVYEEFMERLCNYRYLTGNSYIIATGRVSKPPLELFVPSPQAVSLAMGRDGFTSQIELSNQYQSRSYNRYDVNGRFKYYDKDGVSEIYHIRSFNPYYGINQNYGLSELAAIYYEVEQFIGASQHNLSLISRGVKTTGAFLSKEPLSDDQYQRLQEQINSLYAGASNAGRPILLDGGDIDFREMGVTAQDMDFDKLYHRTRDAIYNRFKIPLAGVTTENMKYDNLEQSQIMLYHNCILPIAKSLFKEMNNMLVWRYDDLKDCELTFDMDSIPAIQVYRMYEMKKLKELGAYTINEIRALRGDKPVQGGDVILAAQNNVPVARDTNQETYVQPADDTPPDSPKGNVFLLQHAKDKRDIFMESVSKIQDGTGRSKYSQEDIRKLADKFEI
jgi:HK97 family phage portal protein